jgi:hypothetical protein
VDRNGAVTDGGGIYNENATLDLSGMALGSTSVDGNHANSGGAVATVGGVTTMTSCIVRGNTAQDQGGALWIDPSMMTIISCTFSDNTAPAGADLYNLDSTVTIIASSIANVTSNGGTVTDPFANLLTEVAALNLGNGVANSLSSKLHAAEQSLERGNATAAGNQLEALINQVNALVNSHRLGEITADSLIDEVDILVDTFS